MHSFRLTARPAATLLWLLFMTAPLAFAFQEPARARLENFDRRANGNALARRAADPNRGAGILRLRRLLPDARVEMDDTLGTPAWVRSQGGFLSGPKGEGRGIPAAALGRHAARDPARAAKAFLDEHRAVFGHGSEALADARVQRDFLTPGTGTRTMVWEQHLGGIPLFEGLFTAHMSRRGELVSLSSHFHPDPARAARARGLNPAALVARPPISALEAIVRSSAVILEPQRAAVVTAIDAPAAEPRRSQRFRAGTLPGETKASMVWLPLDDSELRLCWEVLLTGREAGELFRVLIDAQSGEAWVRQCLTKYITGATFRVWTGRSPAPMSPGWPVPNTNQPPEVPRTLVTFSALDTNASPAGWIDDGMNETLGNNVDAHLDLAGDNVVVVPRPHGSVDRVFDFPADLTLTPSAGGDASVVQLFYWCNFMHDRLYELGFTEAAGNFQTDNFGRGGAGGDALVADAQDGSGFNNANFSTPPDGSAPRMQMYLFISPAPDRDGDFDADVVLHEYAHGLTDRRVGGGAGLFTTQSEGLAEGWSDFYALSLLSEPGEDISGTYPLGAYVGYQLGSNANNYYFGIRRYPYCTDFSKNPLTFKDIDPNQAASHPGVPRNSFGGSASEPHSIGEVWCSALWDARARLVQRSGWTHGNQLMLQLVTDALALTPANPNFIQARDAIIQADLLRTGGTNHHDLWTAFAQRGLGSGATAPGSGTSVGVIESFDVPDELSVLPGAGFIASGPVGGPFQPWGRTFTMTNSGTNMLLWSASTTAGWLQFLPASGQLPPGSTSNVVVSLNSAAAALPAAVYSAAITWSNATTRFTQRRTVTLRIGQPDYFTELFSLNDNDLAFQQLTFRPDGSTNFYSVCRQTVTEFPTDPAGGADTGLADDAFRAVTLGGAHTVALYGRRTNLFFIGSNGYLTFGSGDSSNVKSLENHFGLPRVSGLLADLDPRFGGAVTFQELVDRVAVTWLAVPEWNQINENSFQIELFYDATIRITWLALDARRGVAGLSRGGGVPATFVESDLTGYAECPPPLIASLNRTNGCVWLRWPALPGAVYRVDYKSELAAGSWFPLGTTTATNSAGILVDKPADATQRFYRVVIP